MRVAYLDQHPTIPSHLSSKRAHVNSIHWTTKTYTHTQKINFRCLLACHCRVVNAFSIHENLMQCTHRLKIDGIRYKGGRLADNQMLFQKFFNRNWRIEWETFNSDKWTCQMNIENGCFWCDINLVCWICLYDGGRGGSYQSRVE